MPDNVLDYKCPSCSASLAFDPNKGTLYCSSCAVSYSLDEIKALSESECGTKLS